MNGLLESTIRHLIASWLDRVYRAAELRSALGGSMPACVRAREVMHSAVVVKDVLMSGHQDIGITWDGDFCQ